MFLRYRLFEYLKRNQFLLGVTLIIMCWFVVQTRGIWISFFLSYIVTTALLPFVAFLHKHKFPKIVSILIPYFTALIIIVILISSLVNSFIPEVEKFVLNFPLLLDKSARSLNISIDAKTLQTYLSSEFSAVGQNAFAVSTKIFGSLLSLITILIVSFYLLLYHTAFQKWISSLFGPKYELHAALVFEQIDEKLGFWVRGQLLLTFCIGISVFIVLSLLHIPYALPLGILAGMLEVLPTLGPTLAAIPSIIVALTISPSLAITIAVAYVCIQFLENHVLVPNIMQKAVGLNPVLVILGIAIGANLLGIAGALLAVPFISFLTVVFNGIKNASREEI